MRKLKIILATIIILFVNQHLVLAKSVCDEILGDKNGLNFLAGEVKLFFEGYSYAKNTEISYTKSKMKDYFIGSCRVFPNLSIDKMLRNAADTNFELPSSVVNNKQSKKQKIDLFFIRLDKHWEKNEMDRRCVISKMEKGLQEYLGEKYDELEPLRKKTGEKRYSEKMLNKALHNDLDGFFKEMQKYFKKCGLM